MKKLSKLMSLVLALAMCLSLLPATAMAEDTLALYKNGVEVTELTVEPGETVTFTVNRNFAHGGTYNFTLTGDKFSSEAAKGQVTSDGTLSFTFPDNIPAGEYTLECNVVVNGYDSDYNEEGNWDVDITVPAPPPSAIGAKVKVNGDESGILDNKAGNKPIGCTIEAVIEPEDADPSTYTFSWDVKGKPESITTGPDNSNLTWTFTLPIGYAVRTEVTTSEASGNLDIVATCTFDDKDHTGGSTPRPIETTNIVDAYYTDNVVVALDNTTITNTEFNGTVTITGKNVVINSGVFNGDVIVVDSATLTINGGTFKGKVTAGDDSGRPAGSITLKGGSFSEKPTNASTNSDIYAYDGYKFVSEDGYYKVVSDDYEPTTPSKEDVTVNLGGTSGNTANVKIGDTVTINDGNGNTTEVKVDENFTLTNPTRDGYDFDGWTYDETSKTFTATWKEKTTTPSGTGTYNLSISRSDTTVDTALKVGDTIEIKFNVADGDNKQFYGIEGNVVVTYDSTFFEYVETTEKGNLIQNISQSGNTVILTTTTPSSTSFNHTDDELPVLTFKVVKDQFTAAESTAGQAVGTIRVKNEGTFSIAGDGTPDLDAAVATVGGTPIEVTLKKTVTDDQGNVTTEGNTVPVTFIAGENGTFAADAVTTIDVVKGATITKTDLPAVTANEGYTFNNVWSVSGSTNPVDFSVEGALVTVESATTFTAQYTGNTVNIGGNTNPEDPDPDNPGWKDEPENNPPKTGENYTGKINPYLPEVYDYDVYYWNRNEDGKDVDPSTATTATLAAAGISKMQPTDSPTAGKVCGDTFIIPGADVKEGLNIKIIAKLKGTLAAYGYGGNVGMVFLEHDKLVDAKGGFTYDGHDMFYSPVYGGYVYLVNASKTGWKAEATGKGFAYSATAANEVVSPVTAGGDIVEGSGSVDGNIKRAYTAAYIIQIMQGSTVATQRIFNGEAIAMKQYLRADVAQTALGSLDTEQIITVADYQAWLS